MIALYDLMLMQQAQRYNLANRLDRLASRNDLQQFFFRLQAQLKPDVTFEIGAYQADFSRRMSRFGITPFAFEANPHNYAQIQDKISRRAPEVRYQHLAVCDVDGTVTFEVKTAQQGRSLPAVVGNNSLLQRSDDAAGFTYETVTVPATRLETFIKTHALHDKTFSAWIDVEGAIDRVVAGFGTSLTHCLSLIVEVEQLAYWKGQWLVGQVMEHFIAAGFVPVARDFESRHQYNICFLRPDILSRAEVRLLLTDFQQARTSSPHIPQADPPAAPPLV